MHLNQLTIEQIAATGGMGSVYKASWNSPATRVPLAVKFLRGSSLASAPVAFWREARAAARLSHPNIVSLLDAGRTTEDAPHPDFEPGTPYLVMDWVEGTTTADDPPSDWHSTYRVLKEMLAALAHAHACNVLHRDIKPANIMRTRDGATRLTDFGVGRLVDDESAHHAKRTIVGTAPYMAPEQAIGTWRDEGPWTDLYGLAATLWRFITGQPLYSGDPKTVIMAQVRQPIPAFFPQYEVPEGLDSWFKTALAKNPKRRFQTAAQALTHLEGFAPRAITGVHQQLTADATLPRVALDIPHRPQNDDRSFNSTLRAAGVGLFGLRTPPLIGRTKHKMEMWKALRECADEKSARVVFLEGPAGVGKSALADWMRRRVGEGDYAAQLRSTHEPNVVGEVALSGAIAREIRLQGLDTQPATTRISEHLEDLGFEEPHETGLEFAARQFPGTSTRRRLQQPSEWHAFLLEFARRTGRPTPVLWVIEDVHHSQATLDFIAAAAEAEFPLLIVATARYLPESLAFPAVRLQVDPLTEIEMRQLVDAQLPLEASLADSLLARAQGSPMFAMQLLGDWVERDVLRPGPVGYRADASEVSSLPDNIHDVWRARTMTSLKGADGLRALCLAAVMGERIDRDEWHLASQRLGIIDPDAELEQLGRAGLLVIGHHTLKLEHALLRESTLRDLHEPARYHMAAAEALAEQTPTPRRIERIARHLWDAGQHREAYDKLYDAIIAYRTEDEHDVIIFLVPLLRDWAHEIGIPQSTKLAHALTLLGAEFMRRGGAAAGRDAAEEAAEIVFAIGDLDDVIREAEPIRCLAAVSVYLSKAARVRAHSLSDAVPYYRYARLVAAASNNAGKVAFAASHEAAILTALERYDEAREVLEYTVAQTADLEGLSPRASVLVLQQRGDLHELRGELDMAIACYEKSDEVSLQIGDPDYIAYTYERLGELYLSAGNLGAARRNYAHAHQHYQRRKAWNASLIWLVMLALDVAQGEPLPDLPAHFAQQFETERLSKFRGVAVAMAALAEARRGNLEHAGELYGTAVHGLSNWSLKHLMIMSVLLSGYAGEVGIAAQRFVEANRGALPRTAIAALRRSVGCGAVRPSES